MSKGERNETKPPRASQNKALFSVSELSETRGMYGGLGQREHVLNTGARV
jgi:hypothetical protein